MDSFNIRLAQIQDTMPVRKNAYHCVPANEAAACSTMERLRTASSSPSHIVELTLASAPSLVSIQVAVCCRLLEGYLEQARKHGVPSHAQTAWVRRKCGGHILVFRNRADGSLGCATPCTYCQRELLKFDLTVHCSQDQAQWFSGRLCSTSAPKPQLTSGQRRQLHWRPGQTSKHL